MKAYSKEYLKNEIISSLHMLRTTTETASIDQLYKATVTAITKILTTKAHHCKAQNISTGKKQISYLSIEFLIGRSLKNNLFNLNLTNTIKSILSEFDVDIEDIYNCEPDAGLGNGGLGRLAACYLDAMANLGLNAYGYSILYEFGIFILSL